MSKEGPKRRKRGKAHRVKAFPDEGDQLPLPRCQKHVLQLNSVLGQEAQYPKDLLRDTHFLRDLRPGLLVTNAL